MPSILIYNLPDQQHTMLRFICAQLHIAVHDVSPADYNQTLSALTGAGSRTPAKYEGVGFTDPMLVMADFNSEQFNALLQALRHYHIFIALKAVLTPANSRWDSIKLHSELLREHEAMHYNIKK